MFLVLHKPFTHLYSTDIQQDTVKGLSFSYGQAYSGKKAQASMIHAMKNSECDCRNTIMTNASGISRMGVREYRKSLFEYTRKPFHNLPTRVGKPSDTCQKRFWHVSEGFRRAKLQLCLMLVGTSIRVQNNSHKGRLSRSFLLEHYYHQYH